MARSPLFASLSRIRRLVHQSEARGLPVTAGLEQEQLSRRQVLGRGAAVATGALMLSSKGAWAAPRGTAPDVGIVGAGLAGLMCGMKLRDAGIVARLYDGNTRTGGRCATYGGQFGGPVDFGGQVVERGGELIDNLHKTMIGLSKRYGLTLEDLEKQPGEIFFYFNGQRVPEATVVDEYRALVAAIHADLRAISSEPSALSHNAADLALDHMSLADYLDSRGAGANIRAALVEAYEAEYGLAAEEQSALNFLLFIHADKRSRFQPFGVFSDERYHVVGGNEQIPRGMAAELPGQIDLGHRLVAARSLASGSVQLTFDVAGRTVTRTHDLVVMAMPFSTLREVELDANLGLSPQKWDAINLLGYGTNAKTMVRFNGTPWRGQGGNGTAYSDLQNLQTCWETNPTQATAQQGILTDYASAARGASLTTRDLQRNVGRFLNDLDRVFPGAKAAASKDARGNVAAYLEPWPLNPLSRGSYTAYTLGQFTTIAGHEGTPSGRLHFAGEHSDSFYSWQGFMEGACLSGIRAASEIVARS